jgi:hypothetical protein
VSRTTVFWRPFVLAAAVAAAVAPTAVAPTAVADPPPDGDPGPVAAIEARLVRGVPIGGAFTQRLEIAELSRPIVSEGRFYFSPDGAVAWYVDRPVETRAILAAGRASETSAVDGPSDIAWLAGLVRAFVAGDFEALASSFSIEADDTRPQWRATLTPRAPPLDALVARVGLHGDAFVAGLAIDTAAGDRIAIDFQNVGVLDVLPPQVAGDLRGERSPR